MNSPTPLKLAVAGLVVCAIAIGAIVEDSTAKMLLFSFSSGMAAWVGLRRPGDVAQEPARFRPPKGPKVPPAALLLLLPLLGCPKFHEIDWPGFAKCGEPAVDLLADVLKVLLDEAENGEGITDAGKRKMARLGERYGYEAVVCAIRVAQTQQPEPAREFLQAME